MSEFSEYYCLKTYTGDADKILSELVKKEKPITVERFHIGAEYLSKKCWTFQQKKIDERDAKILELERQKRIDSELWNELFVKILELELELESIYEKTGRVL